MYIFNSYFYYFFIYALWDLKKTVHQFPARRPNGKDIVVSQSDTINQHA